MKIISFKNKYIQFFIILIVLLIFLRIDYRFETTIKCCSDEYDYYSHAATIVNDFDLDYSNQNIRDFKYTKYGKYTYRVLWFRIVVSSIFTNWLNFIFFLMKYK